MNYAIDFPNVDCIIKRDKKMTCYDTLKLTYQSQGEYIKHVIHPSYQNRTLFHRGIC